MFPSLEPQSKQVTGTTKPHLLSFSLVYNMFQSVTQTMNEFLGIFPLNHTLMDTKEQTEEGDV